MLLSNENKPGIRKERLYSEGLLQKGAGYCSRRTGYCNRADALPIRSTSISRVQQKVFFFYREESTGQKELDVGTWNERVV